MTVLSFDRHHYVPLLYARAGEMLAVRSLTPQVRTQVTPIWVMPPVPLDPRTDVPTKTPERHVTDVLTSLGDRWGMQPAFLDCHHMRWEQLANGANVFEYAFQVAGSAGLEAVVVLRDDSTDKEWGGYQRLPAARREEVALRISPLLWADLGSATGAARLEDLLARTGLPRSAVHLIVDVADQVTEPATISAAAVRGSLAEVEGIEDWKTLTVVGTAMPATTADVGRDNAAEIPRSEWAMWKLLQESRRRRHRLATTQSRALMCSRPSTPSSCKSRRNCGTQSRMHGLSHVDRAHGRKASNKHMILLRRSSTTVSSPGGRSQAGTLGSTIARHEPRELETLRPGER